VEAINISEVAFNIDLVFLEVNGSPCKRPHLPSAKACQASEERRGLLPGVLWSKLDDPLDLRDGESARGRSA
jgi:hypothetical protein